MELKQKVEQKVVLVIDLCRNLMDEHFSLFHQFDALVLPAGLQAKCERKFKHNLPDNCGLTALEKLLGKFHCLFHSFDSFELLLLLEVALSQLKVNARDLVVKALDIDLVLNVLHR